MTVNIAMFRTRSFLLGSAATVASLKLNSSCDGFDTQGFATKMNNPSAPGAPALTLGGVGMRRKNFYVVMIIVFGAYCVIW